jgi:carboxymethylenebutenolidase
MSNLSISNQTFISTGNSHKITIYSAISDTKKYPVVLFLHGNFGLFPPFGEQIQSFAEDFANLGYITAVPQYYLDNDPDPHPTDTIPKVQILTDAVLALINHPAVDPNRIGLISFSLGAATAMSYISSNPPQQIKALADFFGFITPEIEAGVANFPPTIIFHNQNDLVVPIQNSQDLDRLLPSTIQHKFVPYDEQFPPANHAFQPGENADIDSRSQTASWFKLHLPPTGN